MWELVLGIVLQMRGWLIAVNSDQSSTHNRFRGDSILDFETPRFPGFSMYQNMAENLYKEKVYKNTKKSQFWADLHPILYGNLLKCMYTSIPCLFLILIDFYFCVPTESNSTILPTINRLKSNRPPTSNNKFKDFSRIL